MPDEKPPKNALSVRLWVIVHRAVEEGVSYGWQRAHKHTDNPSKEVVLEAMEDAVMLHLDEVFNLEEEEEDDAEVDDG